MDFLKKCGFFLGTLLLIISVYKDLTSGFMSFPEKNQTDTVIMSNTQKYTVVRVKVNPGDTVLSILEELNENHNSLDINQILIDFQNINKTDPHELQIGNYYYFPLYR